MQSIRIKHALRGPWWCGEECHDAPPPPGLLHGDARDPITGSIQRGDHGPIVGIVDFTAKTRYGFSSRGVPQYLFHPADPRFPPMIVGSKAAPTANQWGIITTKGLVWSTTKSRWPSVSLQQLLGPVGTPEVEAEVLRLRYLRPVPRSMPTYELGATPVGTLETWDTVFNIDPPGCRDVDDILAWRRTAGGLEFGIGIAHVAALVPRGSALDGVARLRAQTLYREGVAIEPMLPPAISEGAGSLLADGVPRSVVWAIWHVDEVATGPIWRVGHVVNQKTYTYESVLDDTEISNTLPKLLAALPGVGDVGSDPHRWVEVAMIAYNKAAAEQLGTVGILRRHAGIRATEYQDLAARTGCDELAFLGYSAGEYVDAATKDTAHAGLGLTRYCHATSPLRRYADLVNQRILVGMLEAEDVRDFVEGVADWLNERAKEARAYEREAWCLAQLSAKELRSAAGWVLGWTRTSNTYPEVRLRIYVPAWRRTVKVTMILHEEAETEAGERPQIRVGNGTSDAFEVSTGNAVQVTAFWNTRSTPEHRFVFHCAL